MQTELVPIDSLTPDPANARKHGKRNLEAIAASLQRFGQQKPIVVDSDGIVWAGNGTLEAARALGWEDISIVRSELVGDEMLGFAIADNRTAELAGWSDELGPLLASLTAGDIPTDALGFNEGELSRLTGIGATEDEAPGPPAEPITQPGDLWVLGDHRLVCGDSTNADDVARLLDGAKPGLMVTDPPYGVEYDPAWRDKNASPIRCVQMGTVDGDDLSVWDAAWRLFDGAVVYSWCASWFVGQTQAALEGAGLKIRNLIVWKKQMAVMSRGNYHWQHELCWYAVRDGKPAKWSGDRGQTTVWDIRVPIGVVLINEPKTGHGTQKPVECMARPIRNHDFAEVYDPFLGSGTTLIACEQLNRKCYALDIDPTYCDVAVERWVNFTGGKAERLPAGS